MLQLISKYIGSCLAPNQTHLLSKDALELYDKKSKDALSKIGAQIFHVCNPSGLSLEAARISCLKASGCELAKSPKMLVIFNGLGSYHYHQIDLAQKYSARGFQVIIFNYRGIGYSQGKVHAISDFIEDGQAIVDHLHCKEGIALENIILHGVSFGGGVASATAVTRPGVSVINDRSFTSLAKASGYYVQRMFKVSYWIRVLLSNLASWVLWLTNWDLDVASLWGKIKGRKSIVYHPNDGIVPLVVSLFRAVCNHKDTRWVELKECNAKDPHFHALTDAELDDIIRSVSC